MHLGLSIVSLFFAMLSPLVDPKSQSHTILKRIAPASPKELIQTPDPQSTCDNWGGRKLHLPSSMSVSFFVLDTERLVSRPSSQPPRHSICRTCVCHWFPGCAACAKQSKDQARASCGSFWIATNSCRPNIHTWTLVGLTSECLSKDKIRRPYNSDPKSSLRGTLCQSPFFRSFEAQTCHGSRNTWTVCTTSFCKDATSTSWLYYW